MGEGTPLIRRDMDDGGPRRRTGPQHSTNIPAIGVSDQNYSYAPSLPEFDKADRRPFYIRIFENLSALICAPKKGIDVEGDYYHDHFNDQPWRCSFGTSDADGTWMNRSDQAGTIMSLLVWILIIYAGVTVTLLAQHNHLPKFIAMIYCTICALALASHAKTMFSDPGAIPPSAVPLQSIHYETQTHTMCSHCQSYKPPVSHHCRICNRCISRMDHHCPWMNNCVGAGNMKHFILFLAYTWTGAAFALILFSFNYFLCSSEECTFSVVLIQLVRAMTVICFGSILFTSSMLMNVQYGVMTGIGTIDRLKKKAENTLYMSDEEAVPLASIFGIGSWWTWWLPIDPVYEDYDTVMGFSTPQRLLRERVGLPSIASMSDSKGYSEV